MSYEPTEWKSGDVVSSQKLNKIENGIVNSGLVKCVDMILINDSDSAEIDCTWQQLYDWVSAGYLVFTKTTVAPSDGISGEGAHFSGLVLTVAPAFDSGNGGALEESYIVSVLTVGVVDSITTAVPMLFEASASNAHPITISGSSSSSGEPSGSPK